MMVSKSGYIINEIYVELRRSMMSHDYERVCYWSTELVCSGQIKQLVSWILCLCCNEYVNTNCFVSEYIVSKCNLLMNLKYKWKTDEVRQTICNIILILSQEEPTTSRFYKQGSNYKTFINSLYFIKNKQFRELQDNMGYLPHNEVYVLINYLYEFMLQNDIKSVFKILYHLLLTNNVDECETLDIVRNIKRNKNDIVWALWKVLMIFTNRPPCDPIIQRYVNNSFQLFSFDYTKKIRGDRMNILFVCYLLCVKRKEVSYVDTNTDWISETSGKINELYSSILKDDDKKSASNNNPSPSNNNNNKTETKKVISSKKIKNELTPEKQEQFDEKMKYFFCIAYRDNNRTNHNVQQTKNNSSERSYKELSVEDASFDNEMSMSHQKRFHVEKL